MVKKIIKYVIILGLLINTAVSCNKMSSPKIDVSGTVYARYQNQGRYGSTFIMVVKMDDGHIFDLQVSPSTFASRTEGSRVSFSDVYASTVYPNKDFNEVFWNINFGVSLFILGMWFFWPVFFNDFKEK